MLLLHGETHRIIEGCMIQSALELMLTIERCLIKSVLQIAVLRMLLLRELLLLVMLLWILVLLVMVVGRRTCTRVWQCTLLTWIVVVLVIVVLLEVLLRGMAVSILCTMTRLRGPIGTICERNRTMRRLHGPIGTICERIVVRLWETIETLLCRVTRLVLHKRGRFLSCLPLQYRLDILIICRVQHHIEFLLRDTHLFTLLMPGQINWKSNKGKRKKTLGIRVVAIPLHRAVRSHSRTSRDQLFDDDWDAHDPCAWCCQTDP
jgi:hypothetical protein